MLIFTEAAAGPVAAHVLGDLGGEALGAGQVEDGRPRMRTGGDDRRANLLAGSESHSRRPAVADVDRDDLGVGAHRRAGGLCRARDGLADRPHPADHLAPDTRHAVELAERVVQQVVGGAGRSRAGPDADHAARGDRALHRVVLEPVVEQVADRHGEDPDQVVHVPLGEARPPGGLAHQGGDVEGVARPERGRLAQEHRPQEIRRSLEQVLEVRVHLTVLARMCRDRGGGLLGLVEEEDRPIGRHRRIGGVERDRPVAEVVQPEVGDDLRLQHRDDVGGPRDPGSRPDLLGHARTAENRSPLEHDHVEPGARQIRGGGETVVPPAHDDRVVARGRWPRGGRCAGSGGAGRRLDGGTLPDH